MFKLVDFNLLELGLGIFALSIILFLLLKLRPKKLDPQVLKSAKQKIKATAKLDPSLSLIESHKILTNAVQTMFKNKKLGSAKLLNKALKNFKNEKEFWYYHRMRNRVAHENDFKASKTDSAKARKIFEEALSTL